MRFDVSAGLTPHESAELRSALHHFNAAATGYDDGADLGCVVRDEDGRLVAGIEGFTWGGYARLEYLWVAPEVRGTGLGTALVDAAIDLAAERGCHTVVVDSHTFQAPGFYRRLGFVEVGRTRGTPTGYDQVLMQRNLAHPGSP